MPDGYQTILLGKKVTFKCPGRDPGYYGEWVGTIESVYFKEGECWVTLSSTDFYDVKLSDCQIHNAT